MDFALIAVRLMHRLDLFGGVTSTYVRQVRLLQDSKTLFCEPLHSTQRLNCGRGLSESVSRPLLKLSSFCEPQLPARKNNRPVRGTR